MEPTACIEVVPVTAMTSPEEIYLLGLLGHWLVTHPTEVLLQSRDLNRVIPLNNMEPAACVEVVPVNAMTGPEEIYLLGQWLDQQRIL